MNDAVQKQIRDVLQRGEQFGLWQALDGQPIFISGGTGFFGRWLLETLVAARQQLGIRLDVTVLTRNKGSFFRKVPGLADADCLSFVEGDIQSFAFPAPNFAYILHGAATSAKETFDGENGLSKFDMAMNGGRRMLDFAVQCRPRRMLMLSSGSVYSGQTQEMGPIRENYVGAPSTMDVEAGLSHGKRASEFLCAAYAQHYQLSISVARCFSFVGAYLPLNIHYAIGNFIRNALFDDAITVQGDGTPLRSYLAAGDLVIWLLTLLIKGNSQQVYNVGSDHVVSLEELAYLVRDTLSPDKPVRILKRAAGGPRHCYAPNIDRARADFGLDVWTSLADAIAQTADAARLEIWADG